MKFKNIYLVLIVLLIIFYLGAQISRSKYDKGHTIALLVLLVFCTIGHFLLKAPFLPGPVGILLKFLFVYGPMITLFILMVVTFTGSF